MATSTNTLSLGIIDTAGVGPVTTLFHFSATRGTLWCYDELLI